MISIDHNILVETGYQGSNNAIVRTTEGLALVDAPMLPSDAVQWRRIIDRYGPVRYLVNTDHHPDHTLGNSFLPGEIVAHDDTRARLIGAPRIAAGFREVLQQLDPAGCDAHLVDFTFRPPSLTFSERMSLHIGDVRLDLVHLPGHTLNSIVAVIPDQGVAFTGDLVCEAGFPSFMEADTYAWIDAVRVIEAMDLRQIVPGHGEICGPETVTAFRRQMEDLVEGVARRIDRGDSRDAIVATVRYEDNIHTAVNGWTSYSAKLVDHIMTASIGRIHDDVLRRRKTPQ